MLKVTSSAQRNSTPGMWIFWVRLRTNFGLTVTPRVVSTLPEAPVCWQPPSLQVWLHAASHSLQLRSFPQAFTPTLTPFDLSQRNLVALSVTSPLTSDSQSL